MEGTKEDVSYIRARDPSIRYFNRDLIKNARKNIGLLMSDTMCADDSVELECDKEYGFVEDNCTPVYLRIKGGQNNSNDYTIKENLLICRMPEQVSTSRAAKNKSVTHKKYCFTKIFGPDSKQIEIFDNVVKFRVLEFINGKNKSLFTYGASGAGKTFTIIGTAQEPGLVPRALEYLFRTLPKLPVIASVKPMPDGNVKRLNLSDRKSEMELRKNILQAQKGVAREQIIKTYSTMQARLSNDPVAVMETDDPISLGIWVSFAEIYNEEIYDLLQPTSSHGKQAPKLKIGMANGKVYIKDLTYINVSNGLEAYQVFIYGIQKIKYAETTKNNHSSRSHSIFCIKIAQALDNGDGVHVSSFSFCDLAGVERTKKTLNVGDRLKESNSINKSLMVLGRCIAALRHSQKCPNLNQMIPFRDSKLTQLFQKAFCGLEDLCMVVNINISKDMLEESHNVLNFSVMTREVTIPTNSETKCSDLKQRPELENTESLDEQIDKLEQLLKDTKRMYENSKEQRIQNCESEERDIITGYEDLFEANKNIYDCKSEALEKDYAMKYSMNKVDTYYNEK
ncbi:hypothetical protein HHI36_022282 [Cryptolaemus montrouzieri]|uniref:Kinesin motor domain-containing protein n=1 Tax=Cryptolaemus montrouzieri TaxID=559131 RepID=A0ABD2N072_9CUCU